MRSLNFNCKPISLFPSTGKQLPDSGVTSLRNTCWLLISGHQKAELENTVLLVGTEVYSYLSVTTHLTDFKFTFSEASPSHFYLLAPSLSTIFLHLHPPTALI